MHRVKDILAIFGILSFLLYSIQSVEASPIIFNHFSPGGCTDVNRTLSLTTPYMSGPDVLELQKRLLELGYSVPTNGIYSEETAAVVKKFQQDNGLEPTAAVDPCTWEALGKGITISPSTTKANKREKPESPIQIVVEVNKQRLTVFSGNQVFQTFPVAVGKHKTPTPHGEFKVISKGAWGGGFGTRWLGLNVPWGTYGIHGTNKPWSIGRYASHGCIRMFNKDVETLFPWVPVGTPVKLINKDRRPPKNISNTLKIKSSGQVVVFVQEALKARGFLMGMADGIYGRATANAVSYFQAFNNLPITGKVDSKTYQILMAKE